MAVTTINNGLSQEKGVNYTVITDSSADWASVANSTYFYDKTDKLPHYKDGSGNVLEVFASGGSTYTSSKGITLTGSDFTITDGVLSKTFTLESPTATEDMTIFRTDVAITVQEIIAVSVGTSPSTTYQLKFSTDRNAAGTALTTSSTTTSTTTGNVATLSDATIPANSWVWFESTAASGTNVKLTIDIRYTID